MRDGDAEGRDGEIVAAQPDRGEPDEPARRGPTPPSRRAMPTSQGRPKLPSSSGLRRRGQDRVRIAADRVEADDAGIEQAGESPLQVEAERRDAEDQHDAWRRTPDRRRGPSSRSAPLGAEQALRPEEQHQQQQQERHRGLVAGRITSTDRFSARPTSNPPTTAPRRLPVPPRIAAANSASSTLNPISGCSCRRQPEEHAGERRQRAAR